MRQMFDDKQVKALAKDVVKEVIPETPKEAGIYLLQVVDSDVDANAHILMRVSRYDFRTSTLYIFGQYINDSTGAVIASYTGTINCNTGVYTITKHSA